MATITVGPSGRDYTTVQAAVNAAAAGDTIVCDSGVTFTEDVTLPTTQHATPVKITSSTAAPNRRVAPSDASNMATITAASTDEPTVKGDGVKGWEFEFIRFYKNNYANNPAVFLLNVNLGGGSFRNTQNITFDRVLIEGGASGGNGNGLYVHGANITVDRCYIHNIRRAGQESHAFVCHDGPGPFVINDNFLEAASINCLFGGWTCSSTAHTPNNITFTNNYCFKRLSWVGAGFAVKNLFELKHATNVTVSGNTFENNWTDGQDGHGILFQATNDAGDSPWTKITDVLFKQNIIRNTERGINLNGYDYTAGHDSSGMARITFKNNLFEITTGRILTMVNEIDTLTVDHNTFANTNDASKFGIMVYGTIAIPGGTTRPANYAIKNYTFRNNLLYHAGGHEGEFGLMGTAGLDEHVDTAYDFSYNVMADGPDGITYPTATNQFPSIATFESNFVDLTDYELTAGSSYRNAGSDGLNIGHTGLAAEGSSSVSPSLSPTPSASVSPSVSPSASFSPSASPSPAPPTLPGAQLARIRGLVPTPLDLSYLQFLPLEPDVGGSPSASVSPSASISPSASVSPTPSVSPSASASPSVSPSASLSPSASPSRSVSPSASLSPSSSPSPSLSPSASPSASASRSISPSASISPSSSVSPSASPSAPGEPPVLTDVLVRINSTDRTSRTILPSGIDVVYTLGGRAVARLSTRDTTTNSTATAYSPDIDETLLVTVSDVDIFGGRILGKTIHGIDPNGKRGIITDIDAIDYSSALDHVFITKTYTAQTPKQIFTDVVDNYLAVFGITVDGTMSTGGTPMDIDVDHLSARELFNRVALLNNWIWRLTPTKVIRAGVIGTYTAPFTLSTANHNMLGDVQWSKRRVSYANRVRVRFGGERVVVKTLTMVGDGLTSGYPLPYTPMFAANGDIISAGYVTDNGVNLPLNAAVGGVTWSYNPGTNILSRSSNLPNGHVATFNFNVQFPVTVTVEDAAEVAARGPHEEEIEAPDITEISDATAYATAQLNASKAMPREVRVRTAAGMAFPGDVVTLTVPERSLSGSWLIIETHVFMPTGLWQEYEFTCLEGSQLQSTWLDYLSSIFGGGTGMSRGGTLTANYVPLPSGILTGDVVANTAADEAPGGPTEASLRGLLANSSVVGPGVVTGRLDSNFATAWVSDQLHGAARAVYLVSPNILSIEPYILRITQDRGSPAIGTYYLTGNPVGSLTLGGPTGIFGAGYKLTGVYTNYLLSGGTDVGNFTSIATQAPTAGTSAYGADFSGTFTEAGSGTHSVFATARVQSPAVTAGGAALDNAIGLYVSGQPTGGTANYALLVSAGFSGAVVAACRNVNGSTADVARWQLGNDTAALRAALTMRSTGYTSSGPFRADGCDLFCDGLGGVHLVASHGSGELGFWTGGSAAANERARFKAAGHLVFVELGADPSASDLTSGGNVQDRMAVYTKNNKVVIAFNNAGTVTYATLALDGISATWSQSTTAP